MLAFQKKVLIQPSLSVQEQQLQSIMSEETDSAPTMSIKDRIAALQKGKGGEETTIPIGPPPQKPKRSNALAGRIAALQQQTGDKTTNESGDDNTVTNKVGKLKLPPGGVPIIMPGAGPPPSLLKKQKEREERKQKMVEEAQKDDSQSSENDATIKEEFSSSSSATVGKLKLPPGAIQVIVPGCPPPAMLKKTDVDKNVTAEDTTSEAIAATTSDEALLSRPTMPKRKPRSRG